jgi:MFS transporter, CP family, cyanate transporter
MTTQAAPRSFTVSYSTLAFLLLAANLRPAVTSVGPLLEMVRSDLGLSSAMLGLLATLPLLIFAAFSPFARLGQIFGIERTLAGCLSLLVLGIAVRSQGSTGALFGGTAILAIGIAIANVLVPSVIKRDFPDHVGSVTTVYVMVMTLTGALATGLAVPLAAYLAGGWRASLAIWVVLAAVALLFWLPETRKENASVAAHRPNLGPATTPIWRSWLAWQVTLFMGVQFLIYYVTISWMPLFLAGHGKSAAEAGWLLTLYQMMTVGVGFVAPLLLQRGRDQRVLAVAASAITALSILGLFVAPRFAGFWLVICGASFGTTFILAFALIGMRASDHQRATSLSTMSQATAYLIAAIGPVAFGWLHDLATGWTVPMLGLLAIAIIQCLVGLGAGRPGYV